MNIVDLGNSFVHSLQAEGCSPFFFTSAIQSAVFGEVARAHQAELVNNNIEFRQRMQNIKDEFTRDKLDAQRLFKRESYELGKQFVMQQTVLQNNSRQKQIEFKNFCNRYWPLNFDVYSMLTNQNSILETNSIVPLRVLIAKTEITSFECKSLRKSSDNSYGIFCEQVKECLSKLPNISVQIRPWKNSCQSIVCESLNLNYIMQGMPTLLIFPYQIDNILGVEVAVWSFNRGPKSMMQKKLLKIESNDPSKNKELAISSVQAITGMIRDSYMLCEYHAPIMFPEIADSSIFQIKEIRKMLQQHYTSISERVDSDQVFKELCSVSELNKINHSLDSIKSITA